MKSDAAPSAVASKTPQSRILQFAVDHFEPHISEKSAWSTTARASAIRAQAAQHRKKPCHPERSAAP
jgi:hypothetical protein